MRPNFKTCLLFLSVAASAQVSKATDAPAKATVQPQTSSQHRLPLQPDTIGITFTMRTNLYLLEANNTTILADGILTEYNNQYTDSVTIEDALKFTNVNENLGQARHGYILAVERRPLIVDYDTMYLKLWRTTRRSYQFEITPTGFMNVAFDAFLLDRFLNTRTPLNLYNVNRINFSVTAAAASADIDRFAIMYAPAVALPVRFTGITAYQQGRQVKVDWSIANELNIAGYELERSDNGISFTSIQRNILPNSSTNYSGSDAMPLTALNFYRVKAIGQNGAFDYSPVVKVNLQDKLPTFSIYPNPVKGNLINLVFQNQPAGVYQLRIINNLGQTVDTRNIRLADNTASRSFSIEKALPKGVYQLDISGPGNVKHVKQLIVQ